MEIDETNKRICKLLYSKGYTGYDLYNLYPEISSDKTFESNKKNNYFIEYIKEKLEAECNDLILFFGRTVIIPQVLEDVLTKRYDAGLAIKITTHNDEFIHPGNNGDIDLKNFSKEYIRSSKSIRINNK